MVTTELQSSLKTVSKECEASSNKGTDTTIRSCKIFALSYHEAGCITTLAENYYNKLGSTYELFNDSANKINIKYPDGTNVNSVWLRGYQRSGGSYGLVMQSTHKMTTSTLTTNLPYLFGFCI